MTDDMEVVKFAQSLPDKTGEYHSGNVMLKFLVCRGIC